MSDPQGTFFESAEQLFEEAPCGYLLTRMDGTILRVNRTFESLTGHRRDDLVGKRRFDELLSPGGRIYHETHYAPLLQMQGAVGEIALEFVRADQTRLPALVNSVVRVESNGRRELIRTTIFDATERRNYERELVAARRREREIAQRIQQSLLSGPLPEAPGLELGVSYQPAVAELEVGGDWYDAFWLADGETIGLVVGDVVGRGIEAAATMGQLRSALRALASTGLDPGGLLTALDEYARRHDVGRMTTVVCGRLHLPSRTLTYACAGHPPPLVVEPSGRAEIAWGGRSTPIDTFGVEPASRDTATVTLPPGGAVLFYTDGLVEQRHEALDVGLARLVEAVARHSGAPAQAVVDAVGRSMHSAGPADNVCLLMARCV